jgi:serine/threonine-protein kinase
MAPEMANGEPVDRRTDLYALGCVAYWLLTGELVFEADSPLRMLIQHIQTVPLPPSLRSGRPVPAELERLVMRCLEKRPDRRPASADEIAEELDRMVSGRGWTQTDAREWWDTHIAAPASEVNDPDRRLVTVQ